MARALALAEAAAAAGEVPVGAVVELAGAVVGEGNNRTRRDRDPTAHAEIVAIRAAAAAVGNERLAGATLFVTLEPCAMCAGAIVHARLGTVVYGAGDPKGGAVEHGAHVFAAAGVLHRPAVVAGVGEGASAAILRAFFAARR